MKKILIQILLMTAWIGGNAQAVLEHVYSDPDLRCVKLSTYGWVYSTATETWGNLNIKVYSNTHTLIKTISFAFNPMVYYTIGVDNLSDKLFNLDDKIEVPLVMYPFSYLQDSTRTVLINEDGAVLQTFIHQVSPLIIKQDGVFKLITVNAVNSNDTSYYVYSLPGTMVDAPTMENFEDTWAYPNPCQNRINIVHPPDAKWIRILSLDGRTLLSRPAISSSFTTIQTLNLPAGNYIFEVTLRDQKKITGKFSKQ